MDGLPGGVARAVLAALAIFVPRSSRRAWRREWEAEFTVTIRADQARGLSGWRALGRLFGAAAHAWWLRREEWRMTAFLDEIRFSIRLLRRHKGVTVAATVTLALAIGANAAVYSVLQAVVLRPIPARDASRLVVAWQTALGGTRLEAVFSYPDYRDWKAVAREVEGTALITWNNAVVTGAGDAERLQAASVTAGFFELLGVPVNGRAFEPADEGAGAERVAIVSETFRRRHLAGVAQPLGALMTLNGASRRIVGIVREDALDGVFGAPSQVWLPIGWRPQLENRGNRNFTAIARLAPRATSASAQRELLALLQRLERDFPATNAGRGARVLTLRDQMAGPARGGLELAAAGAALLLLIACANVASLMVARGLARTQEFATRAALGATRGRLARQVVTESLVLSALGTACGLALFAVLAPALVARLPLSTPRVSTIGWHPGLLAFGAAAACLTAILSSLPAASRVGRAGSSSRHTDTGGRVRDGLAALQIATACVALVVAGLLATSLIRLQRLDAGFDTDRTLTMQLELRGQAYATDAQVTAFVDRLVSQVDALPSVERAAVLDPAPFTGNINRWDVSTDAHVRIFKSDRYIATPSVFDVLRVRPVQGRVFGNQDAGTGGVVVDEIFAARAFPGANPLGRHFRLDTNPWLTVVGVVPHIRHYGLDEVPRPQVYVPFAADPSDWINLIVLSRGEAAASIGDVRRTVLAADANVPPFDAATFPELVRRSFGDRQLASSLALALALLTVVVAAAGLYGTMEFTVSRRTREIGVRLALGAQPGRVVRMVLWTALRVVMAGTLVGLPAAIAAARAVRALLYDTRLFDPAVYAAMILVLAAVSVAAAMTPARRAARVDPVNALRVS